MILILIEKIIRFMPMDVIMDGVGLDALQLM